MVGLLEAIPSEVAKKGNHLLPVFSVCLFIFSVFFLGGGGGEEGSDPDFDTNGSSRVSLGPAPRSRRFAPPR